MQLAVLGHGERRVRDRRHEMDGELAGQSSHDGVGPAQAVGLDRGLTGTRRWTVGRPSGQAEVDRRGAGGGQGSDSSNTDSFSTIQGGRGMHDHARGHVHCCRWQHHMVAAAYGMRRHVDTHKHTAHTHRVRVGLGLASG